MSRCELTGMGPVVKNLVSHSNIKTKSEAQPNVQSKRLFSKVLNGFVRLQISTSAIKSMEHMGGFDKYILNQGEAQLSKRAKEVRDRISRKMKSAVKGVKVVKAEKKKKA